MNGDLWQLGAPWWHFVVRGLLIFGAVLVVLRISGKRQLGQMTPFDLVLLLLISEAAQNALVGDDHSIPGGLLLIATLIAGDSLIGWITRHSRRLETLVEGEAELLIHNGRVRRAALRQAGLTRHDLLAALREADCASIAEVHAAILETNGRISVLTRKEKA